LEKVAKVRPLDKLHDKVVLPLLRIAIDRQNLHDVGVGKVEPQLSFPHKQINGVGVLGPALAQNLYRDNASRLAIIALVNAAETPRSDFVKNAIAADEVAVHFSLQDFGGLIGSQEALALENSQQLLRIGEFMSDLIDPFEELGFGEQSQ